MRRLDAAALSDLPLPVFDGDGGKDERGRVLVVGGHSEVPGGALLAGLAAMRVGAGKLQIMTAKPVAPAMAVAIPEARVVAAAGNEPGPVDADAVRRLVKRADCLIIGPGMLDEDGAAGLAQSAATADTEAAFLLDAAAITGLSDPEGFKTVAGRLVMTPHAGEMARLLDRDKEAVEADAPACAVEAARRWSAVVALKGPTTHIATPEGGLWVHEGGVRGLATSGSGDVLAGIVGGFLARGATPETATAWGVFLHGAAGRRLSDTIGPLGFLARELLDVLPGLLNAHGGARTEP